MKTVKDEENSKQVYTHDTDNIPSSSLHHTSIFILKVLAPTRIIQQNKNYLF